MLHENKYMLLGVFQNDNMHSGYQTDFKYFTIGYFSKTHSPDRYQYLFANVIGEPIIFDNAGIMFPYPMKSKYFTIFYYKLFQQNPPFSWILEVEGKNNCRNLAGIIIYNIEYVIASNMKMFSDNRGIHKHDFLAYKMRSRIVI